MCGVVGVVGRGAVNQILYDSLILLQHRGQDAAGIMTCSEDGRLHSRKSLGLVRDVFQERHMLRLQGRMGLGHVRYPTAGCADALAEVQPFYVNSPFGIALAHNGNLINAEALKAQVVNEDRRHINTESDSEILLNVFAHELYKHSPAEPGAEDVFYAVASVHRRLVGAYSVVAMIAGRGLVAFRDPYGIRPLVYGRRETPQGVEHMVASESVALEGCGFEPVRDLDPGEALYIDLDGQVRACRCSPIRAHAPCIFEFVYFARPDSVIEKVSVHRARMRMGQALARKIQRTWPDHDIDVVIPIPDTSRTSALELALTLGLTYREGFIKNRYIGRTFIMPGQTVRQRSIRQKLNPIAVEFKGKNVLLVDDSIVRGNTSRQIIQMAREAGARQVYMASAAPPVRYPNVYGIDMPARGEFVAHGRDERQIAEAIGADRVIYQDLPDLVEAVRAGNPALERFDCSCFDGEYITGGVDAAYLDGLEARRNDRAKQARALASG
ncbi:MAG: amidophosphoribosyltransferase [Gammaproteobacteria bacterium]|nr:MAG: amidophosphoribosyltransferase [Gammaproteobacteria bacterium]